jgi:integrase
MALDALAAVPEKGEHYFWTGTGKPKSCVGDYQRALRKAFIAAGVTRGTAHNFRHTFATDLLSEGIAIETAAVLLGHRSVAITAKHYNHWIRGRQEKLEDAVKKVWSQKVSVG